jgi:glucosamine kinase
MAMFLGIDGGGTGCRAAVADASGRVLGLGTGGPANVTSDPEGARRHILDAASQALAGAVGAAAVAETLPRLRAGLGLAGANSAGAAGRLQLALPFAESRIVTDGHTAVLGALGAGDGLMAAIGTGSVFASQRGGVIRQIGGKGLILGDEGSGAWLGRRFLARVLRAVDGFAPLTPLGRAVLDERGGEPGVIAFAAQATPAEFAGYAPRLAQSDDPLARAILREGAAEVATALDLLRGEGPRRAVFLGGLGAHYADLLAPDWQAVTPLGTALDGALLLARGAA